MNDAAVQKQITNMVSFIEKEANEKASEIRVKSEEDFTIEKARIVQTQKQKIAQEFEKKEKQVLVNKKIAYSNDLAKSRLQILKAREAGMQQIIDKAKQRLDEISQGAGYKDLVVRLIVQGLVKLEAEDVEIKSRSEDRTVAEAALPLAIEAFKKVSGKTVKLTLSKESLPPSPKNAGPKALQTCSGGVVLSSNQGRIVCNNTLDVRLQYAYDHAVPEIREKLFAHIKIVN